MNPRLPRLVAVEHRERKNPLPGNAKKEKIISFVDREMGNRIKKLKLLNLKPAMCVTTCITRGLPAH